MTPVSPKVEAVARARIFSRLVGLVEAQEAKILADPLPYLIETTTRYCELRDAVEKAIHDLDGHVEVIQESGPIRAPCDDTPNRNRAARERLWAALEATRWGM